VALASLLGAGASAALALLPTAATLAASSPSLRTDHGCYLVGQPVAISGAGFAPGRQFVVTIDWVYFGSSTSDTQGAFTSTLRPGGLGAGVAQHVDSLMASDGTTSARAAFTVTRRAGARFLASSGDPRTLQAPFEVWGFALDGISRHVYLHYVSPSGRPRKTVLLGNTSGQCGHMLTAPRRVFPFSPSSGRWTFQLDTNRRYFSRPLGPAARIGVQISG
jgi:hypothetical protein